ncbi:MAG: extradiol ring-cleavage dioxygenase [Chloroflexi bacterium]|nr:extradiol ring-cleavage dioxygenase [Chloroflexota bacterium]
MADLVLGLASSHSPQLSTPAEGWAARGERDKGHIELIGTDGITSNFEELLSRCDTGRIAKEITPEKFEQRHQQNQKAIAQLSQKLYEANLDVLVMVGDDQQEYLLDDNMPAFCVYWGDQVRVAGHEAGPSTGGQHLIGYNTEDQQAPTDSALGRHIIERLMDAEFDVGRSSFLDPKRGGRARGGIGHAFGYVYNRLMTEAIIPTVPIMLNTYYPPNQPTPKRCYNLGQALKEAIESWPGNIRVGILASGGLSHFVVDEELDQAALAGMQAKSMEQLMALPREKINSGSSEIRNWIVVTGATEHLDMNVVDYVPCYRSPAGTGCAMGFATWE